MAKQAARRRVTPKRVHSPHVSFWHTAYDEVPRFPRLQGAQEAEVCVVGAGITGMATAYLLSQAGLNVVVVEKDRIGSGTSGQTSAHLDPLTDVGLSEFIRTFGADNALKVIDASQRAVSFIEQTCFPGASACEFERVPAFLFAEEEGHLRDLWNEREAAEKLDLPHQFIEQPEFPRKAREAIRFDMHAQFHPIKYLGGLARALANAGVRIYEKSPVQKFDFGPPHQVKTLEGSLRTSHVVMATHYPVGLVLSLQTRVFPYRSYLVGVRVREPLPKGLFWDLQEPYHYIRGVRDERGDLVLVGGADHKVGSERHTEASYARLEAYARSHLPVVSVDYRWSSQFYSSADRLPYIGELPLEQGVYVGTGYDGTGLTLGVVAAELISDHILQRDNPLKGLLSPARVRPLASAKRFVAENTDVARHFVADRLFSKAPKSLANLGRNEGEVIRIEGKQYAVYRDPKGKLHFLSPVCTHAQCIVQWNSAETTWDCPCHGGRYTPLGEVLNGPPMAPLGRESAPEGTGD